MITFAVEGAEPLAPDEQLTPWRLWLGRLDGALVGILTDPAVMLPGYSPDSNRRP